MLTSIIDIDQSLFTLLNSFHSPFFDPVMEMISAKLTWLGLYVVILLLLFIKDWKQALLVILMIALVITLADQISASIIKPLVERLRPSHNEDLSATIHIVNDYRGGKYGFVSNHAANVFGVATFLAAIWRRRVVTITLIAWALIVSYSRIYLGVHYPGDILCGGAIGALVGVLCYYGYLYLSNLKFFQPNIKKPFSTQSAWGVCAGVVMTFISFMVVAAFML